MNIAQLYRIRGDEDAVPVAITPPLAKSSGETVGGYNLNFEPLRVASIGVVMFPAQTVRWTSQKSKPDEIVAPNH